MKFSPEMDLISVIDSITQALNNNKNKKTKKYPPKNKQKENKQTNKLPCNWTLSRP